LLTTLREGFVTCNKFLCLTPRIIGGSAAGYPPPSPPPKQYPDQEILISPVRSLTIRPNITKPTLFRSLHLPSNLSPVIALPKLFPSPFSLSHQTPLQWIVPATVVVVLHTLPPIVRFTLLSDRVDIAIRWHSVNILAHSCSFRTEADRFGRDPSGPLTAILVLITVPPAM